MFPKPQLNPHLKGGYYNILYIINILGGLISILTQIQYLSQLVIKTDSYNYYRIGVWGKGYPQTFPPNPKSKSKIQIRTEVADRDSNFSSVPVPLCGGAPTSGPQKSGRSDAAGQAARMQQAEDLRPVPLPSCGPFPVPILEETQAGAVPGPRSTLPRSRSRPSAGPFPALFPRFPLLLPVLSASVGRVRALILGR